MTGRQLVETNGEWLELFAFANGLEVEADTARNRMCVDYQGMTFVAPLGQVAS